MGRLPSKLTDEVADGRENGRNRNREGEVGRE